MIGRLTIISIMLLMLSSCFFTSSVIKQSLKEQYVNPHATAVKHAFYQNGVLHISYSVKSNNNDELLYSLAVPVDTLLGIYKRSDSNLVYFDEEIRKEKKAVKAYKMLKGSEEYTIYGNGLVVEMDNQAIFKGVFDGKEGLQEKVTLLQADTLFSSDISEGKKTSLKFIYTPYDPLFNYVLVKVANKKKKHPGKLLYLPISIVGDVVTFPLQAFYVIFRERAERPAFFEFPNRITAGNEALNQ